MVSVNPLRVCTFSNEPDNVAELLHLRQTLTPYQQTAHTSPQKARIAHPMAFLEESHYLFDDTFKYSEYIRQKLLEAVRILRY